MDKSNTRLIRENFDYLLDMYSHAEYFREEGESWAINVVDECDCSSPGTWMRVRIMLKNDCMTCPRTLYRNVTRFAVISRYQLGVLWGELSEAEWIRHETIEQSAHYFLLSDDHEMEDLSPTWQCWKCSRMPGGAAWRSHQK